LLPLLADRCPCSLIAAGNLIVYRTAIEAAAIAIALVRRVPAPLKSLADQAIRFASSVPANLSEGHGRSGRDRIHHWRIAFASAKEVDAHLSLLSRAGAVDAERAAQALELFDRVRAMTWRLLHPKR
jgi:four helix bundle protein